jgi:hypothetical protein
MLPCFHPIGGFRINKFCHTQIDLGLEFVLNEKERCLFIFVYFQSFFFNIVVTNDENDKKILIFSCTNFHLIFL